MDIDQIIGKTDFEIFPDTLAEIYSRNDQAVMAQKQQQTFEEAVTIKGQICWLEIYKAPLLDYTEEVLGTVGFSRDISRCKKFEDALH